MSERPEPGSDRREPDIYDVVELPESEKGDDCPMHHGGRDEQPRRCNNAVEYVFVYEAFVKPWDDSRKNCLCCAECKPAVTADDGLRADGGARYAYSMMTDTWYLVTEYEDLGDGQLRAKSKEKVDREEVPQEVLDATEERGDRDD